MTGDAEIESWLTQHNFAISYYESIGRESAARWCPEHSWVPAIPLPAERVCTVGHADKMASDDIGGDEHID